MAAWIVVAIVSIIASISDAALGVLALAALLNPSNYLGWTLCFGGGFIVTGMTMAFSAIFSKGSPLFLQILWITAAAIDAFTTIVSGIIYVVEDNPIGEAVDISSVKYDPENWIGTTLVFGLTFLLTGCSIATTYVFEKLKDEKRKK